MVWYSHLLKNFPQFVVMHTVKGFSVVNKAEVARGSDLPGAPQDEAGLTRKFET